MHAPDPKSRNNTPDTAESYEIQQSGQVDIAARGAENRPNSYSDGDSVTIRLSRGMCALIDAVDLERVSQFKWSVHDNGCGQFYAKSGIAGLLHRFILDAPADMFVDHRNGDGLDCRRENLRTCLPAQNNFNRNWRVGPSGYRGVVLRPSGRWRAQMKVGGKTIHCGMHDTAEQAARAYDAAVNRLHGEYARLNFPHTTAEVRP